VVNCYTIIFCKYSGIQIFCCLLDEKEKAYSIAEGEIQALKRKIVLLEEELER
jgi:hypothetical protein